MKHVYRIGVILAIVALVSSLATLAGEKEEKMAREIGLKAEAALDTVLDSVEKADPLFQEAVGWAYFDVKMLGESAQMQNRGAGDGVIMAAGARSGKPMHVEQAVTYQQDYEFVIFFQTKSAWEAFIGGWEGGDTPKASAMMAGLDANSGYVNGVKVYQIDEGAGVTETANIATAKFRPGFR